jgi:DNA-binding NtrC family response regulator
MSANFIVVHDRPGFAREIVTALSAREYKAVAFVDPSTALATIEAADQIEVLVARIAFEPGKLNGVTLARMALKKHPRLHVLLTGPAKFEEHAEGVGEFVSDDRAADILARIERLLRSPTAIPPAREA